MKLDLNQVKRRLWFWYALLYINLFFALMSIATSSLEASFLNLAMGFFAWVCIYGLDELRIELEEKNKLIKRRGNDDV